MSAPSQGYGYNDYHSDANGRDVNRVSRLPVRFSQLSKEEGKLDYSGEEQAQRLERVYSRLGEILRKPGVAGRVQVAPGEDEWSAMQILAHMVEMIPYWMNHCELAIAAEGEPTRIGRSLDAPERLEGIEQAESEDLEGLMGQLDDEVRAAAVTIRQMSADDRRKKAVYLTGDEISVTEILERFVVGHAESHLEQLQSAINSRLDS